MSARSFPMPEVQEDGILVKMGIAAVCGTDPHIYHGRWRTGFPLIQGHESMGRVAALGRRAHETMHIVGGPLKEGDRITWYPNIRCEKCWYCQFMPAVFACESVVASYGLSTTCDTPPFLFGGFAEYHYLLPGTWIFKLPDDLSDELGALVNIFTIAVLEQVHSALANGRPGFSLMDNVVIQGSGPVGAAAAVRARLMGAGQIIMTGRPQHRLDLCTEFGVDVVINIDNEPDAQRRIELVRGLTGGRGAGLVVEAAGTPDAIREGLQMLRRGGVYYELGNTSATGSVELIPSEHLVSRAVQLIVRAGGPQQYSTAIGLLRAHRHTFPFERLITHRYPLEEALHALEMVESCEAMKAVIVP